ncbi:hypothetical protein [Nostoc sp. CCY0012]|uniref:hypothetical protein n=1 Tax=Nostoc sp. CCY0012 TaxID=1056123 RepID=UPI0039C5BA73
MGDSKYKVVSFRRPSESLDGKVIDYLRLNPLSLEMDYSEAITSTLKKCWLPLALFSLGLRGENLRQIGIWAISELEAQISVIRRICGIDADPVQTPPVVINQTFGTSGDTASIWGELSENHSNNNSQSNAQAHEVETDDEGDDWDVEAALMGLPKPEELRDANRILGSGD